MQFVIVSYIYLPEPSASAQTNAQIAEKMTLLEHQVEVLVSFRWLDDKITQ